MKKYTPPFPLNQFPNTLPYSLGQEIAYLLATRATPRLEGSDWEEIFARLIGGQWKPSNAGLDDVLLEQTAWSAKTVKAATPSIAKKVRLISGRNSPAYSFNEDNVKSATPTVIGQMILDIWNERVTSIRSKYAHLRTVVLVKSDDLLELALFEFDTILYDADQYDWIWNDRNNLEGRERKSGVHRFTWQPHGSQFTIIEEIPDNRLALRIRKPPPLSRDDVLATIHFNDSWVELLT